MLGNTDSESPSRSTRGEAWWVGPGIWTLTHFLVVLMPDSPLRGTFLRTVSACLLAAFSDSPSWQLWELLLTSYGLANASFLPSSTNWGREKQCSGTIKYLNYYRSNQKGRLSNFWKWNIQPASRYFKQRRLAVCSRNLHPQLYPRFLAAFWSLSLPWGKMESRNSSY